MFTKFKKIYAAAFVWAVIFPAMVSAASSAYGNLQNVGTGLDNAPYQETSLAQIVNIVIQAFLGILGVLFLVYTLYAGYHWMTAQGDEEKVTKAKDTLQRAVVGLIVTVGAYAITYFVMNKLVFSGGIIK